MVWAKLDDEILDNEKIAKAGVLGFALHVAAITWCCRKLTDGFVPHSRVRLLLDFSELSAEYVSATKAPEGTHRSFWDAVHNVGEAHADEVAKLLVGVGLWREDESRGGYWVHDFLDYNPSKEEAERLREARSEAGRRGGAASAGKRSPSSPPPKQVLKQVLEQSPKQVLEQLPSNGSSKTQAKLNPDPDPDPDPDPAPREIPPTPQGVRVLGPDGDSGVMFSAYTAGVRAATGRAMTALQVGDRKALVAFVNAHAEGLAGSELEAWVHDTARDFARQHDPTYGGYSPAQCAKWLDGGRKARGSPSSRGAEITKQPTDPTAPWMKLPEVG